MSSAKVVQKTTRRTVISGGQEDVKETVTTSQHSTSTTSSSSYHVFRGMSPTTQNRLENRVKELEEALEQERAAHLRTQTEFDEIRIHLDNLNDKLESAEKEIANQIDTLRRRDQELLKAKKDSELLSAQYEASETSLKRRFQDQINELTEQFDRAYKTVSKLEKDKQHLIVEVEGYNVLVEETKKAKMHAESRVEGLDDLLKHLRAQVEEFSRTNQELVAAKVRLTQENADLLRQVQDVESKSSSTMQSKMLLQQKLDATSAKLEDERRLYVQLEGQFSNVTADFENLRVAFDDQKEETSKLLVQLQKELADSQMHKARFEKEITIKIEEYEDLRRKSSSRLSELESLLEQAKLKASRLEKEKSKLVIQIEDLTIQFEEAKSSLNEHIKQLKQAEITTVNQQKRIEELNVEVQNTGSEAKRLQTEQIQAKQLVYDLQVKIDAATKENQKLKDAVHELELTVKELSRQEQELLTVRNQLQLERESQQTALSDANDNIQDLQLKLDAVTSALHQLKIEAENVSRSKNDEIEIIRKNNQRTIDELHLHITELESRIKLDSSRWKKKIESEQAEFQVQIDSLSKGNTELLKTNKNLNAKLKDVEALLEAEKETVRKLEESAALCERKFLSLQTELQEVRIQLTAAEKARRLVESEISSSKTHITEINVTVQTLTVEKRRLESDLAASQRVFDDTVNALRAAEERAEKLSFELARANEQTQLYQSSLSSIETKNKQQEVKIRELTMNIEQMESTKDGKRSLAKLQSRVSELEKDLEFEQRNGRELVGEIKKLQRQTSELKKSLEDEHRRVVEYSNSVTSHELKITTLKRQLKNSEEMLGITLAKYRKTQQLLEEAERRADKSITVIHQKSTVTGAGSSSSSVHRRSYSVTRKSNASSNHSATRTYQ